MFKKQPSELSVKEKNGFTLPEILIVLVIVGILAILAFFYFSSSVEKSKNSEALKHGGAIRQAEEVYKAEKGTYVAAGNTEKINDLLGLGITSKYFEYEIVGADENNFTILAKRIDDKIRSGVVSSQPIVISIDQSGSVSGGSGYSGSNPGGSGGNNNVGGSGDGGTGGGAGGGVTGGGGGGGGGTGGGGTGDGGNGGSPSTSGGPFAAPGGNSGGGWSNGAVKGGPGGLLAAGLANALALLENSNAASYAYDLIRDKGIPLTWADLGDSTQAQWSGELDIDGKVIHDKIEINTKLKGTSPDAAIAALIAHEATHADYAYFPDAWIAKTLERHSELTAKDLSIPYDSINQEYDAFCNQMLAWEELKGSNTDTNNDNWYSVYYQGEATMRAEIRAAYDKAFKEADPPQPLLPNY